MEDHSKAALIWNYKTREELREALENEIRSFTVDKVTYSLCRFFVVLLFLLLFLLLLLLLLLLLSLGN